MPHASLKLHDPRNSKPPCLRTAMRPTIGKKQVCANAHQEHLRSEFPVDLHDIYPCLPHPFPPHFGVINPAWNPPQEIKDAPSEPKGKQTPKEFSSHPTTLAPPLFLCQVHNYGSLQRPPSESSAACGAVRETIPIATCPRAADRYDTSRKDILLDL